MISATTLLWTRIGAGVLLILIAIQVYQVWRTRRTGQAALLILLLLVEFALAEVAVTGEIPETAGGLPLFVFLIPLACIALGAGGLVRYLQNLRQTRASARWPTVEGTITESKLAVELDPDGDEKYRADIRFAYRVDGREFEGSNVKWGWNAIYAWRSRAAAALTPYPVGKPVTVHYDPAQPTTAVLEPLNREGMAMPLVFAVAVGGIGVFVLKFLSSVA
jgi:hypothetical protein